MRLALANSKALDITCPSGFALHFRAALTSVDNLLTLPPIATAALAVTVKVRIMDFIVLAIGPTQIDAFHAFDCSTY
jgi:hypothetical protein